MLFDVIPEHRLQECFNKAFETHDSSFPISAYDLQDAWRSMAPAPERKEEYIPIPIKYCVNRGSHINNLGDVADEHHGTLPCESCRTISRKERLMELEADAIFESLTAC